MQGITPAISNAILLQCPVQHYEWGRRGSGSLVARLKGDVDPSKPYAELWIGAHPKAPSIAVVADGSIALDQLIRQSPVKILGSASISKFGPTLPLLFKALSIGGPLSIQAHPDKRLAVMLHANDPAHYTDVNHKPEIAIALSRLELLVGFRPLADLRRSFEEYPEVKSLIPSALTSELFQEGSAPRPYPELIKDIYEASLCCPAEQYQRAMNSLKSRLQAKGSELKKEGLWFIRCFEIFGPADVGLASIFILNLTSIELGQAIFLGANIPHAYLEGELIECMANSDNVVRAGLTQKFQDRTILIDMLDYSATIPAIIAPTSLSSDGNHLRFETPAEEFFVERLAGRPEPYSLTSTSAEIVLLLEGGAELFTGSSTLRLKPGDAALIPACASTYSLALGSGGIAFRVGSPL